MTGVYDESLNFCLFLSIKSVADEDLVSVYAGLLSFSWCIAVDA